MTTEGHIAKIAAALIGSIEHVTPQERQIIGNEKVSPDEVESIRALIKAGSDPLGEMFAQVRSPKARRDQGATYTPPAIVGAMVAWAAKQQIVPARVVDPGAGSGRFLIAAAKLFPQAQLVGVEIDPLAALMLRANAAVLDFSERLTIKLIDYRELSLPRLKGATLFIGNPPYVRHHQISEKWKTWFANTAKTYGFKASKLAGLHVHFFLKTRSIAKRGDFGAFITAAEWLDVNYGSIMRAMLADGLGGTSLHLIAPAAMPFADTMTTGAITCFRVGDRPSEFTMREVNSIGALATLDQGRPVSWSELAPARKWSPLIHRSPDTRPSGYIELGELFRVQRGQVTGCNRVWIESTDAPPLPEKFLRPAITRARDLLAVKNTLWDTKGLRRVVDLPIDLTELADAERDAIEIFLYWAQKMEADKSYVARHRRAWWSVGYKAPPAILCTYMARRAPHFVRNAAGVVHINIAHGFYPREPLSVATLDAIVKLLHHSATTEGGRIYAGGLVKFEPKEIERLMIPPLESVHDITADMDARTTHERRTEGAGSLPT